MADNFARTPGSGEAVAGDEVTDATLGTVKVQYVKLMDGTLDGTTKAAVGASGLAVSEANSAAIKTAVETIDNAISGSEMQVDVVAALPAGTNAIGKLAANSGVDIGDVDVASVVPGTAATNLGKAVSSAKGATDTGVQVLGIRDDTLSVFADAENDYEPFHMTAAGRLYVSATVDAALPAGTAAIGKLAANSGVDIGDVDILSLPGVAAEGAALGSGMLLQGDDGTDRTNVLVDTTGHLQVDIVAITAGDTNIGNVDIASAIPAGDNNIGNVDIVTLPASTNTLEVVGDVAACAAAAGNPVLVGVKSVNALPAAVDSADSNYQLADLYGRTLVAQIDPAQQIWKSYNTTTTAAPGTIWTPTTGKKIAITHYVIGAYGTTAARLIMWFGASGDITYTAGSDQLVFAASFAPTAASKPGAIVSPPGAIFCTTANYILFVTTDAALSVDIAVYGYEW